MCFMPTSQSPRSAYLGQQGACSPQALSTSGESEDLLKTVCLFLCFCEASTWVSSSRLPFPRKTEKSIWKGEGESLSQKSCLSPPSCQSCLMETGDVLEHSSLLENMESWEVSAQRDIRGQSVHPLLHSILQMNKLRNKAKRQYSK